MILAIDIGNTRIVMSSFDNQRISNDYVCMSTNKNGTDYEYETQIKEKLNSYQLDPNLIEGVVICSSVPEVTKSIINALKKLIDVKIIEVTKDLKTGINIDSKYINNVGPDLIVGALATKCEYKLPAFIIDMGTATTITVVDDNSNFVGGTIIPGINISKSALINGASMLQDINIENPTKVISLESMECIKSGLIYGNASLIDGMIDRIIRETKITPSTIVATGGDSKYVIPYCDKKIILDEFLLIKGMKEIWQLNN